MKCDNCENMATYTSILVQNGKKTEVHLCTECAIKAGVLKKIGGFPFANFFEVLEPKLQSVDKQLSCSRCHTTATEFLNTGKVGCSQCFNDLREVIAPMVQRFNADRGHKPNAHTMTDKQKQLFSLKNQLKTAIAEERYEDAGEINKQIKILEAENEQ